ncbi:MAG: pantoate--beta-alanine ligase [Fimbriimonadaceae bacterium]
MRVFRSVAELQFDAPKVGFVPTMGALHEGHVSLMRRAKLECGFCVASIFVNPTQFGPNEDFNKYPRDEARDFELAKSAGVDAVFCPSVESVYNGSTTTVRVGGVTDLWEGPLRPGHFEGVATVVHKLFGMVRPTIAYFGLKDFQQCCVIAKMVSDLYLPIELVFCETVREPDGLAMSSRNRYLSQEERALAPRIYAVLNQVSGSTSGLSEALLEGRTALQNIGFRVEYLAAVNTVMQPIETREPNSRLIVAAWLGTTRLIDNIALTKS